MIPDYPPPDDFDEDDEDYPTVDRSPNDDEWDEE